jgi:hypothetical protein
MGFCTNCGASVDSDFCGNCGAKVGSAGAPVGPPTAPPAGAPAYSAPAPTSAAPPKKRGPLFWVLLGCGGLILIGGIIFLGLTFFVYRAAKQAGLDPALMQKNPAMAVAKMMAAINPDIEVLSVDEATETIKVREKKTGKVMSVNLAEAKKGKIVFEDDKSGKVEIQAQGEGDKAGIEIKGADGSLSLGANAGKLPDWLPPYPDAESMGNFGINTKEGKAASLTFKTKDSIEDVVSFYENALKGEGMEVEKSASSITGLTSAIVLAAKDSGSQRSATMTIGGQAGFTVISLMFESKK